MEIRCWENKRRTAMKIVYFWRHGAFVFSINETNVCTPNYIFHPPFSALLLHSCKLVLSSSKSVWGVPVDGEINFAPFNSLGEEMIPNILMGKWVKFMNFVSKYFSDYSRSFIHLSDYSFRPQIIFIKLLMGI